MARWQARGRSYRGAIMLLQGRAEFIEKYYETVHDLLDRGYAIVTFDWRGQGLSDRLNDDRTLDHIESLNQRIEDLEYIRQRHFDGKLKEPHYVVGHSMGAHIMLRHMLRHRGTFERYVALSPMLGIAPVGIPESLIQWTVRTATSWGLGMRYMITQKPMRSRAERAAFGARLTRDQARLEDTLRAVDENPDLHLGGTSIAWMHAAYQSCAALMREAEENTQALPLMMLLAGDEMLVNNAKSQAFARSLPAQSCEVIDGARHELLKEIDDVRREVLGKIIRFFRSIEAAQ
ncbi:MAG: alpha/beta hydrolase [Pseudomonadota bacterium]